MMYVLPRCCYVIDTLVIFQLLQVSWLELCVSSVFASPEISLSPDGIIISQHYANDYISCGIRVVVAVKKPV